MGSRTSQTWYEATAPAREAQGALRGVEACDACVIGGGLAGITTARELQRRGRIVVLLEAGQIAGGASGRNGGSVSNGFSAGIRWTRYFDSRAFNSTLHGSPVRNNSAFLTASASQPNPAPRSPFSICP